MTQERANQSQKPSGPLKNSKHEIYARSLAKGLGMVEAFEAAGYKPHRANAHRLLTTNENVRLRIAELTGNVAKKTETSLELLVEQLEEIRDKAMKEGKFSAAASAVAIRSRITGFWTADRLNDRTPLSDVPDDQIEDELQRLTKLRGQHDSANTQRH